ncbi:MAG: hypothetical protein ABIZ80_07910, partial [Bryobacteraceae bacterium]
IEVEWGGSVSTTGNYSLPAVVKYTPEGDSILWGRTEFSAWFDSLESAVLDNSRLNQFSDHVSFGANSVVYEGAKLDVAIGTQASYFLRDQPGLRIGATAIGRYDWGRNSAGLSVGWSGATASSDGNPAGTMDLNAGFGRKLRASGFLSRCTAHSNVLAEKYTGQRRLFSIFEGLEYQFTDRVALDVSGQHLSVGGGIRDHQISMALTVNTGHLKHRR